MQIGVDTGGTFTDLVTAGGEVVKVLSTPDDPGRAIRGALGQAGGVRPALLAHGTTVATNALLERRGATVALVTTEGLRDVVEIGRQDRPSLYDQLASRPEPLVARAHRYEVTGRLGPEGDELVPVDTGTLPDLDPAVEAVAVCLLHADLAPGHEQAVAEVLRARGLDVTCSHEVSPEMREVERTVTTVINAALRPRCRDYLWGIDGLAGDVLVMTSAGGLLPVAEAADLPAALLLSGPAGGVRAAAAAAVANGYPDAITFDMGGTSTDVCLVVDGAPAPAAEREVAGFAVRFPSLDVHTIGAGGGSIARVDPGGALVVGPESAGADPGPACYGRGGEHPTVTDAHLVAGHIPAEAAFGGLALDRNAAAAALDGAGVTAAGVLSVVDANMERALRAVSVERGVDPRRLALVAFGGAGPLHACELADALDMPAVVVPARAGVLSAVGLLTAPRRRDLVRSWPSPDDHEGLGEARRQLARRAAALVGGADVGRGPHDGPGGPPGDGPPGGGPPGCTGGSPGDGLHDGPGDGPPKAPGEHGEPAGGAVEVTTALDCRYRGQSHELAVADVAAFHVEHRRRNGYARPDDPVEVVALRATATRPPAVEPATLPAPDRLPRGEVVGPSVIAEADCTVWVAEGWVARAGEAGALVLERREGES